MAAILRWREHTTIADTELARVDVAERVAPLIECNTLDDLLSGQEPANAFI